MNKSTALEFYCIGVSMQMRKNYGSQCNFLKLQYMWLKKTVNLAVWETNVV